MEKAIAKIEIIYESKPVIVIYDTSQEENLEKLKKDNRHKYYQGIEESTLEEIKLRDSGILFLNAKDCRGIDARFNKDSEVVILAEVKFHH